MATLTAQQIWDTSTVWANKHFVQGGEIATFSMDDLNAAVSAIDTALDTTLNAAVSAGHGAQTVVQALNSMIPAPFNTATAQQKAELLSFAVSKRYGLI